MPTCGGGRETSPTGACIMSVPGSVADVIQQHVTLTVECLDRLYLNVIQQRLQVERGMRLELVRLRQMNGDRRVEGNKRLGIRVIVQCRDGSSDSAVKFFGYSFHGVAPPLPLSIGNNRPLPNQTIRQRLLTLQLLLRLNLHAK
jgi:hypothetical protein